MSLLNKEIVCGPEQSFEPLHIFNEGNVIVQSSDNSQTLYIDGAGEGGWPIYIGVTKSRGTQENKLPVEANDILGGLQVYARVKQGSSLGYSAEETPLIGSAIFKVGSTLGSSELLLAVADDKKLKVRVVLDSDGNLKVAGNLETGALWITDEIVNASDNPVKFVKVYHEGTAYAMPIYSIQETPNGSWFRELCRKFLNIL
jgi:hypothetical protein